MVILHAPIPIIAAPIRVLVTVFPNWDVACLLFIRWVKETKPMTKIVYVTKTEYDEIGRFEDEGGAPRDLIYVIIDEGEPDLPVAIAQATGAA
jgi:hypothetical protein